MDGEILARIVFFVVMVGSGILMLWLAWAAASGRLKRNQAAGVRLPSTLASDEAWLVAHQAAERPTKIAGWCAILGAVPALLPVPFPTVVLAVFMGTLGLLGFTLYGAKQGSRAARNLSSGSATG